VEIKVNTRDHWMVRAMMSARISLEKEN